MQTWVSDAPPLPPHCVCISMLNTSDFQIISLRGFQTSFLTGVLAASTPHWTRVSAVSSLIMWAKQIYDLRHRLAEGRTVKTMSPQRHTWACFDPLIRSRGPRRQPLTLAEGEFGRACESILTPPTPHQPQWCQAPYLAQRHLVVLVTVWLITPQLCGFWGRRKISQAQQKGWWLCARFWREARGEGPVLAGRHRSRNSESGKQRRDRKTWRCDRARSKKKLEAASGAATTTTTTQHQYLRCLNSCSQLLFPPLGHFKFGQRKQTKDVQYQNFSSTATWVFFVVI